MYLVASYSDSEVAQTISRKLESVGVFTCIKIDGSKILGLGFESASIYALSKEQQEDAISFIRNPNHRISSRLSKKEIEKLHSEASNLVMRKFNIVIFLALVVIAIVVLLFIYFIEANN